MRNNRYALLTVDTEALPNRAPSDHVKRLMWGKSDAGTAGVREICEIGNEFGAKHIFFVDLCGCYRQKEEVFDVIRWLSGDGQDVELHSHPEYLPNDFWPGTGFTCNPKYMNLYTDDAKSLFILQKFGSEIVDVLGRPIRAFRAGSFRWNASTLRALKKLNIPLSFNNTATAVYNHQCNYCVRTNKPFLWSNGVIEIPVTEKNVLSRIRDDWWARFQFPLSVYVKYRPWWAAFIPYSVSLWDNFLVCLIHSWSLLYRDENGFEVYRDDKPLEGYRKLIRQLTKDYDIITTAELLDLINRGKIVPTHTEDMAKLELPAKGHK